MIDPKRVAASLRRLGVSPTADAARADAARAGSDPFGALFAVHPDDAMLAFALRSRAGALDEALDEYFRSALEADRVVGWALGGEALDETSQSPGAASTLRTLDFGAGHGRVTRFLSRRVASDRLLAVEVDPSGVAHLERLGVRAAPSPLEPARFAPPGFPSPKSENGDGAAARFDRILAFSVASHLPERTFEGWLRRWLELLEPGGALVVSALGPETLLPGRVMPADGFHFERVSESRVLDEADYGTAWVSEARFARAIDRASDGRARWRCFPRALWQLQDLWLITWGDHPLLESAPPVSTAGRLEALAVDPTGRSVHLAGWAVSRSLRGSASNGAPVKALEPARCTLSIGDRSPVEILPSLRRDDVASLLGAPGELAAGFRVDRTDEGKSFSPDEAVRLEIDGFPPFAAGSLGQLALSTALATAAAERDALRARLDVVEASGFGRARRGWMRAKAWAHQRLGRSLRT